MIDHHPRLPDNSNNTDQPWLSRVRFLNDCVFLNVMTGGIGRQIRKSASSRGLEEIIRVVAMRRADLHSQNNIMAGSKSTSWID